MAIILEYNGVKPTIHPSAFIAQNAVISGNVVIEEGASIWYNCVLRGDVAKIVIGKNSNIQDGTIIHGTRPFHTHNKTGAEGGSTIIGSNVTVGHLCLIHAGIINNNCFVGMGSIIMDLSIMEENSMIAAGTLLSPKKVVNSEELWGGRPARFMRKLTQEEIEYTQTSAKNYHKLANEYKQIELKK